MNINANGAAVTNSIPPELINAMLEALQIAPKVLAAIVALWILVFVLERSLIGLLCNRMAKKKGYRGYFWTGFILSWLGFVYVVFLPDLKMQASMQATADHVAKMEAHLAHLDAHLDAKQKAE